MKALNPFVNLREEMSRLTMTVKKEWLIDIEFRGAWLVFLGLRVIEFGCWLCGIRFEEE